MNDLILEATSATPHIHFNAAEEKMLIEGESYPENATRFYEPVFDWVENFFAEGKKNLEVHFRLNYFNTSSSKCILDLLELLEDNARGEGCQIRVIWHYHEDDEDILQSGEEFAEDVSLNFSFESY